MGYQTAPHGSLGLPGGLYQFMVLILKAQHCPLSPNKLCRNAHITKECMRIHSKVLKVV